MQFTQPDGVSADLTLNCPNCDEQFETQAEFAYKWSRVETECPTCGTKVFTDFPE